MKEIVISENMINVYFFSCILLGTIIYWFVLKVPLRQWFKEVSGGKDDG